MGKKVNLLFVLAIGVGLLLAMVAEIDACTRVHWNTLDNLKIVA